MRKIHQRRPSFNDFLFPWFLFFLLPSRRSRERDPAGGNSSSLLYIVPEKLTRLVELVVVV